MYVRDPIQPYPPTVVSILVDGPDIKNYLDLGFIYEKKENILSVPITKSERAFKNTVSEYDIKIVSKVDPLIQMKLANDSISRLLVKQLEELHGIKLNIGMEILFEKMADAENIIQNSFTFTVKSQSITIKSGVSPTIHAMNQDIAQKIDQYTNQGSGWVISAITRHFLKVNKYSPLAAKSYIKLPDAITNRKATINIKNEDDKCFMYCLGRALDPNPKSIT